MNRAVKFGEGTYNWLDERLGIGTVVRVTLLHNVPRSVNWWYVFGSAVLTAFGIQVITGIFLAMSYIPSPDHAYSSLFYITHYQVLGNWLRGIHYWGGSAMVMLVFVHMTANFLMGSYKFPRELHWLTGSVLLILTIVMAFTGQLLRWNQDAYWATVVGAQQAGRTPFIGTWVAQLLTAGPAVNGQTLSRFYAIHIWLVPGALITFIGVHLYLVIYKGISEWPVPGKPVDPETYMAEYSRILEEDGEPFFPRAVFTDAVMSMALIVLIAGLAVGFGAAALGKPADPTLPANPAPDWYLIWYFGVLAMIGVQPLGSAITPFLIILFPAVAFGVLFLFPLANKGERHYSRRPWAVATVLLAALSFVTLTYFGYSEPWKPFLINGTTPPPLKVSSLQHLPSQQALRGGLLMQKQACTACHMVDGVGGRRGPNLSSIGTQLSYGQLIIRIAHGGGGMPSYGNTLTPAQINDLVSYLETRGTPSSNQAAGAP
jgi:ubiquinol-cytochrome c reductase cytochrome b subunit